MSNDNPFKSIEEKFLERQRAKQQTTGEPKTPGTPRSPIEVKKYVKFAVILTAIFAIAIILVANLFVVKENEYR